MRGASKYIGYTAATVGWFKASSFPGISSLPKGMRDALVKACNNSVSKNTWASYNSVKKHLEKCQKIWGRRFVFPMDGPQVTVFVAYFLSDTKLKSVSVENMLSALRMLHLTMGHYSPVLRPEIVKNMLRGRANEDALMSRCGKQRLPVTLDVLEMIRLTLKLDKKKCEKEKSLIWAVSTIAFTGGFRIGELLSKRARTIDPSYDLLKRDVKRVNRVVGGQQKSMLLVTLKCPKEAKNNKVPIVVEIFGNQTKYCPTMAWDNYVKLVGIKREDSAAFRVPNSGNAYRHQRFNLDLTRMLSPLIQYGSITGHSFRSGMATFMGQSGFEDSEIQAAGRWSSDAFLRYIKLGRLTRARWASRFAQCLEKSTV